MSQDKFQSWVGKVLRDKWTLDRLIGFGGMAGVFAATHKIGRVDAIKLLDPEIAVSDELRARFEQEARAVNSIGHPGTVEIRDVDVTAGGTPFLVMELLTGQTLAQRVEADEGLDEATLLRLMDELLDVLVAAHAKGIIHRDLKPENLFIQRDGSLKVLDFGIARMRDGVRTVAGTMIGTLANMPPEQIKGLRVDHRADIFGVGVTMFRAIAKRRVHEAENEWALGTKMLTEAAPPLSEVAPQASADLCLIVDRALAFSARRRYPDASTMQKDVRAVREGRPPCFAVQRLQAGDDPHVVELDTDDSLVDEPDPALAEQVSPQERGAAAQKGARSVGPTKPMMPAVVLDEASPERDDIAAAPAVAGRDPVSPTAPQAPAFEALGVAPTVLDSSSADEPSAELEPTDPQKPVLAEVPTPDESPAPVRNDEASSEGTDRRWPSRDSESVSPPKAADEVARKPKKATERQLPVFPELDKGTVEAARPDDANVPPPSSAPIAGHGRRRGLLVALAAVGLVAGSVAVWWWRFGHDSNARPAAASASAASSAAPRLNSPGPPSSATTAAEPSASFGPTPTTAKTTVSAVREADFERDLGADAGAVQSDAAVGDGHDAAALDAADASAKDAADASPPSSSMKRGVRAKPNLRPSPGTAKTATDAG